jgi:hypothetical protein
VLGFMSVLVPVPILAPLPLSVEPRLYVSGPGVMLEVLISSFLPPGIENCGALSLYSSLDTKS